MKRDMDLIREILLQIESTDDLPVLRQTAPDERVVYHLLQLQQAELIAGVAVQELDSGEFQLQQVGRPRLTWAGHEFLDAARSDTVWKAAKARIGSVLESVSFAVLTQALIEATKQQLGMKP